MSHNPDRLMQIEEATRVRPSKEAMAALREDLEVQEMMGGSRHSKLAAGALRVLIELYDRLVAVDASR